MSEVVEVASRSEAEARRDRIKAGLVTLWDDIKAAWRERDWLALGYESWDAMCAAEYRLGLVLPRSERPEIVADLRSEGMSTSAIAAAVGASKATVARDISSGVSNETPEPVVGVDGKTYQPARLTVVEDEVLPADEWMAREGYSEPVDDWTPEEHALCDRLDAGETIVVNMREEAHARLWTYAIQNHLAERIDRKSVWGNPFIIGDDGDRDTVCDAYADIYLPHKPRLLAEVSDLKGKALGCWCAPLRCHGDHLAQMAES